MNFGRFSHGFSWLCINEALLPVKGATHAQWPLYWPFGGYSELTEANRVNEHWTVKASKCSEHGPPWCGSGLIGPEGSAG